MEYKDYYKILGLERGATQDEIKRAFRKLARKFHADVSKEPTAEARFKEISEAYEVLGDAEKRVAYDQLGKEWKAGQEFRPPPDWDTGFEFSGADFERGASATSLKPCSAECVAASAHSGVRPGSAHGERTITPGF